MGQTSMRRGVRRIHRDRLPEESKCLAPATVSSEQNVSMSLSEEILRGDATL